MIGVFPTVRQEVSMKEEKTTPLRQRMIEDMEIRGLCEKSQKAMTAELPTLRIFVSIIWRIL